MPYLMLALNIMFLVAGQIVWKMGLQEQGGMHLNNIAAVIFSPLVLLGISFYGIATILWLFVLSRLPLSLAYPLQSVAYALGIITSWYLFGEAVPLNRWIGAGIIVVGAVVIGMK